LGSMPDTSEVTPMIRLPPALGVPSPGAAVAPVWPVAAFLPPPPPQAAATSDIDATTARTFQLILLILKVRGEGNERMDATPPGRPRRFSPRTGEVTEVT